MMMVVVKPFFFFFFFLLPAPDRQRISHRSATATRPTTIEPKNNNKMKRNKKKKKKEQERGKKRRYQCVFIENRLSLPFAKNQNPLRSSPGSSRGSASGGCDRFAVARLGPCLPAFQGRSCIDDSLVCMLEAVLPMYSSWSCSRVSASFRLSLPSPSCSFEIGQQQE